MQAIFNFLEKYLMGPMGKIATFKIVRAIMGAGMASVPFTIVGSMFLVFGNIPTTFPSTLEFFNNTVFRVYDLFMLGYKTTMGMLAIYFAIVIAYEYAKIYEQEEKVKFSPLNAGLLSMFAFFLCVPQLVWADGKISLVHEVSDSATIINGWGMGGDSVARFGTIGVFAAIIMAVVAVEIYRFCIVKNLTIKMPDSVPEGVSRAFAALIPAFMVAFVVMLINGIFIVLGTDIFGVIAIPFSFVTNMTSSWLGVMVIYFLVHALWIVGIHGANIVMAFVNPILLINMQENINGANIAFAGEFTNSWVTIGGSGGTLGLTLFIAFFARSEQLKLLGRASVVPGLFNINEPIIFGLPIVYNPYLAIPFFLSPMVTASLGYFATSLGFVKKMIAQVPWTSPGGVGAFIGTGGDINAFFLGLICVVVSLLIYLPFIIMYDRKLVKEESGQVVA